MNVHCAPRLSAATTTQFRKLGFLRRCKFEAKRICHDPVKSHARELAVMQRSGGVASDRLSRFPRDSDRRLRRVIGRVRIVWTFAVLAAALGCGPRGPVGREHPPGPAEGRHAPAERLEDRAGREAPSGRRPAPRDGPIARRPLPHRREQRLREAVADGRGPRSASRRASAFPSRARGSGSPGTRTGSRLYASGAAANAIDEFQWSQGRLTAPARRSRSVRKEAGKFVGGLAVRPGRKTRSTRSTRSARRSSAVDLDRDAS